MNEPRERLFRDDGGAALERAARLEDENRRLRAEISRLSGEERDSFPMRERRPDDRAVVALVTGIVAMVVGLTIVCGVQRHHRPGHFAPSRHLGSGRVVVTATPAPTPIILGASTVSTPAIAEDDCTRPYWYGESGVKHYKKACLRR